MKTENNSDKSKRFCLFSPIKSKCQAIHNAWKKSRLYSPWQKYGGIIVFIAFVLSWFFAFIGVAGTNNWNFGEAADIVFVRSLVRNFLGIGAILLGTMIAVGYKLDKRPFNDVVLGFVKGAMGVLILGIGSGVLISTARPIFLALSQIGGGSNITPLDPYFGLSSNENFFKEVETSFGFTSVYFLALVIGFATNLILVAFKRFTNIRVLFVTGHIMLQQAAIFSAMIYVLMFAANGISGSSAFWGTAFLAGIAVGTYWAFASSLTYYPTQKVTENAGFAIGHQTMITIAIAYKIGRFFGRAEDSAEERKLSSAFKIFEDNIFTQSLIIFVVFLILIIVIQSAADSSQIKWTYNKGALVVDLSKYNGFYYYNKTIDLWVVNTGKTFGVGGQSGNFGQWSVSSNTWWFLGFLLGVFKIVGSILVIVYGVRIFVTELQQSFQGISERLIPNSSIGVDIAASFGYAQNSVTYGFISGTIGQFLGVGILYGLSAAINRGSDNTFPILVPIFITLFFNSGGVGVFANKSGGYKAALMVPFIFGVLEIIVSGLAIYAVKNAMIGIQFAGVDVGATPNPFSNGYNGMSDPNFFFGIFNAFLSINQFFSFLVWIAWIVLLLFLAQIIKYDDSETPTKLRQLYLKLVGSFSFKSPRRVYS